ncbi:hypothetical protein CAC42_6052 [Sphaceloma murrayae]|uniref:Manganese/iron superoxide dismutase C-terminal domain-containing protein n=1 Tax=Sphaceloma murrayae TaxID=2082308 RepID=A0A2K1QV70_9PEZI|nr:hypothetical protein CAC42_6052 [Sphaceloma murrayae]
MASKRIARPVRALFGLESRPRSHLSPVHTTHPKQHRTLFTRAILNHNPHYEQHGISALDSTSEKPNYFLSREGFFLAYTDYQNHLCSQLNYITADDPDIQRMAPLDIAKQFQRDPSRAMLFNYGSQAYNNHFFFKGLTHIPRPLDDFAKLKASLEHDFGSIQNLKNQMIFTAAGMFGVGYVWLVWVRHGMGGAPSGWRVLATYNAGTPYIFHRETEDGAPGRGRLQGKDMSNLTPEQAAAFQRPSQGAMTAGAFGSHSAGGRSEAVRSLGGPKEIMPVLCVSVWQHVYVRDYSAPNKKKYLEAWWRFINWEEVDSLAPGQAKQRTDQWGFTR